MRGLDKYKVESYVVDIIKYLSSYYQDGDNIKRLISLIDKEVGEMSHYAKTLGDQGTIKKSTWGVRIWEKELDIAFNPSLSLEDRRDIVLAKVRGRGTTTKKMLMQAAEAFSGGEVEIIEFPEEYYFIIKFVGVLGIPKNMEGFIAMLESIKPAHLEYIFEYTYTTCKMLIDWEVTCDEAKAMTCDELKTYKKGVIK